jgi:carboxylesterase type B
MIEGLRWVQREIQSFGGSLSKEVTIMGHSSGSMAVSLLNIIPSTEGLFGKAILLSGNHDQLLESKHLNNH